ncbi:MAG TPA: hypothetical protein VHQ42_08785, partial [Candidatus Limnocylindria bacterium]|nr:hypothetical protein [Candidatus Limnocylindria bacterium]
MRDLGGRLIIGLGLVVAAVAAIGYVFVYSNIATPLGRDLGSFAVPPAGEVAASWLEDGRPVYVLQDDGEPRVVDARTPHVTGEPQVLVAWCPDAEAFFDRLRGGRYAAGGEVLGDTAASGLNVYRIDPG